MAESGRMLKIDIHTHILPPQIPKFKDQFGYGGFVELRECPGCSYVDMYSDEGKFFRRVDPNCFDPQVRVKEYDQHKVQVQVLSTVPVMFSYWAKPKDTLYISQFLNDHIAKVVSDFPKRFVGLGTLPMQDPQLAIQEIKRGMQIGLKGFQIGSHINQWNLSAKELFPVYQALEENGAALFVHPWDMMGQEKMQDYWLPWLVGMPAETSLAICSMIFGGVFEKFPKLRVAFAHGGGSFPMTVGRVQHGYDCRPDLCAVDNPHPPKKYLGHFYLDSLVHDPAVLRYIIDLVGAHRVCLGTDYPFPLGELEPGKLIDGSGLDQKTKEHLFSGSALEWLNEKKEKFL